MAEGLDFLIPSLLFMKGALIDNQRSSNKFAASGNRSALRLPGSFRRRGFQPDLLMPQEALFARGAHSMQAVMHRALLRRGRSGRYHFLLGKRYLPEIKAGYGRKGGNGSWQFFIIQ